jgi:eukaryotic-like serine/threonine-protein kinase
MTSIDQRSQPDDIPKPTGDEVLDETQAPAPAADPWATRQTVAPAEPVPAQILADWASVPGYEILGELGRGGMGVVYKARQLSHDRLVALKMVLGGHRAHFLALARFRVEAEAVACLAHPNVVVIHEVGLCRGFPYCALEFASGGSLAGRVRGRAQDPGWAAALARTLALAIHHAHERAILHRDLKPANVLFFEDGTPKITDFGLAKFFRPMYEVSSEHRSLLETDFFSFDQELRWLERRFNISRQMDGRSFPEFVAEHELKRAGVGKLDPGAVTRMHARISEFLEESTHEGSPFDPWAAQAAGAPNLHDLTEAGTVMGTPSYMAPEQAEGQIRGVYREADVYALGAILYECLTGQPPFQAATVSETLEQVRSKKPVPPSHRQPKVPPDLETVCLKCLEKIPEQRYRTAAALAEDLDRFLGADPVSPAEGTGLVKRQEG